ncbi:hypothetical protein EAY27_12740 [Vibrio anguillarum]|uniref:AbiU2 domain-containing protein n=1 Tax=Vibrio anguillarum TaxID=55601 RepID=UPI00188CCE7B|nr:hypothetical protein [Vibrio anguillarum]MBF4278055.1 hypothetical protein [Vibrio anguillarum]MBF4364545.1 hypothetical protein [Vibrio anguillarum]
MNEYEQIFKRLWEQVCDIHYTWQMYCDLYAASLDVVDLLNRNGSGFFRVNQLLMLDYIALSLSKLTDPETTSRNKNLSLRQLLRHAEIQGDEDLFVQLSGVFERVESACEGFKKIRNKRIAHSDLKHALNEADKALPGISQIAIEQALKQVREFMNIYECYHRDCETSYEHIHAPYGTGSDALVESLKRKNT